jgi:hypothetical protein
MFQWNVTVHSPLEHIQVRRLRFFNLFGNDKSKDWKVSNDRSRRFPLQLSSGDIFGSEKCDKPAPMNATGEAAQT